MSISTPSDVFLLPLESGATDTGGVSALSIPSRNRPSLSVPMLGMPPSATRAPVDYPSLSTSNTLAATLAPAHTKPDSAWYIADDANPLLRILLDLSQLDDIHGPWVLYGPPQTGKTVLAESIALRLTRNRLFRQRLAGRDASPSVDSELPATNPDQATSPDAPQRELAPGRSKPLCLTAAEWSYQLQEALETNSLPEFQNRFLQAGAVFLDDLHHLKTSPFAQAQLILLLDKLDAAGVPVLITLAQHPGQTDELRVDLCSRLNGGLVLPIEHPGPAAKRVLAKLCSDDLGLQLEPDALEWLATTAPITSFTMLLGTIRELSLSTPVTSGRVVSLAATQEIFLRPVADASTTWQDLVIQVVAEQYQLSAEQLTGPCRRLTTVLARGIAMTLIRSLCDCPLTVLGSLFGNRDHSTVLHALQTTSKKLEKDLTIQASVEQIVDKLRLLAGFHRLPLPAALQRESMFHKQTN